MNLEGLVMTASAFRLLELHNRINQGKSLEKADLLETFCIDSKTFQRDINKLRDYYREKGLGDIIYDRKENCYRLDKNAKHLTEKEIFAICKILIESRAFNKEEFNKIVDKLLILCQGEERRGVKDAINNERFHYLELQHGKALIDDIWKLRQTITNQQIIEIDYQRADKKIKQHKVKPVGIVFSEFYFYLLAFPMDVTIEYPIIFRVDRIETIKITSGTFTIDPRGYDEAGFKKRTPFMYSGELQTIRFEFAGVLEALLDRLPTVRIEKETEKGVIARAEAFGKGLEMWLRSQGDRVRILEKEE